MEKHRCKLCFKSFVNGRALGGHMRSHMMNLYVPPKTEQPSEPLGEATESAESLSSSEDDAENREEEEEEEEGVFGYGLRENPKKSIRLVDPEFSFAAAAEAAAGTSSVVLQDRESETESSKNAVRRRSKRVRKSGVYYSYHEPELKKPKSVKLSKTTESSWVDPEPVSSISDTTPEEDVAYCLMMLSRDRWMREKVGNQERHDQEDEEEDEISENDFSDHKIKVKSTRARAKYRCDTCNKVFRSYQALGGHRASHKKIKLNQNSPIQDGDNRGNNSTTEEKIHECPVCFRVFASGQALGGHKRSHVTGSSSAITTATTATTSTIPVMVKPVTKHGDNDISLIDLNLPAPVDYDDQISQIELSAVSDGEFVKPH